MKNVIGLLLLPFFVLGEAPAPYPASGWKPDGPSFNLPEIDTRSQANQVQNPQTEYGTPPLISNQYRPPQGPEISSNQNTASNNARPSNQYGAPQKQQQPLGQDGASLQAPQNQYGVPQRVQQSFASLRPQIQSTESQTLQPPNRYGAPQRSEQPWNRYGTPEAVPQRQYGAPSNVESQNIPQNQYGAPQQQLRPNIQATQYASGQNVQPQNQYATPQSQSSQQPSIQFGTPQTVPQRQYGAPQNVEAQSVPQNQYGTPLPVQPLGSRDFTQNRQLNQNPTRQQLPATQSQNVPQSQYGTPDIDESQNAQQSSFSNQYGAPLPVQPLNARNSRQNAQTFTRQYLPGLTEANFRSFEQNQYKQQTFRNQNNAKQFSFANQQTLRQQFRPQDQDQYDNNQYDAQNQNDGTTDDYEGGYKTIVLSKEEEEEVNRKYGQPLTTTVRPGNRRVPKRPELTTPRPTEPTNSSEEDFDEEVGGPNIAVATAVANGQYYILLPDGRLQRVVYNTTQTEDEARNNGFSANLMYQIVEPIKDPIYTVDGTPYVPTN